MLTIKGHKQQETKEERKNCVCIKRSLGSFYRTINLPNAVNSSKISAESKMVYWKLLFQKLRKASRKKFK